MYLVGGVLMLVSMVTMIPSVVFTNEYMKLFLQFLDRIGDGWLGYMKRLRRFCDSILCAYLSEILKLM